MSAFGLSPHPMFKELSSLSSTRQSLAFHKTDVGHTRIVAVAMFTGRDVPGGGGGGGGGGFPPSTFTQGTALNMYGGPSSISDSTPSSSSFASSSPYAFTPSRILPELPPAIHLSHAPPSVPSTFLPSYYPEGRHTDHTLPSSSFAGASASTSSSPIYPSMPSPRSSFSAIPPPPRAQGLEYGGASRDLHEAYHRLSQSGPSSEHLLDGVNMSPPRAPRPVAIPTYEFSPGSLPAVLPEAKPWLPKEREWQEISLFDQLLGGGGGGSGSNPSATGNTAGGDAAQGNLHGITTVGVGTGSGVNGQGQGQGQGQFASGSNTSSRRESDIGAGLPPIQSGNFARDYSMSEGIPKSAGYPGMMYGSVALPDGSLPSPTLGTSDGDLFVGPDEYAQALGIYEHILSALPHIRPSTAPMPEDQSAPAYDTLLQLASDGTSLLSGIAPARRSSTTGTPGSVRRGSGTGTNAVGTGKLLGKRANGDTKKATKCLGCGATETPEWRRGPLGPRTLCNACGLVHMKMLRRQKREAERAQAKSGQASGSGK